MAGYAESSHRRWTKQEEEATNEVWEYFAQEHARKRSAYRQHMAAKVQSRQPSARFHAGGGVVFPDKGKGEVKYEHADSRFHVRSWDGRCLTCESINEEPRGTKVEMREVASQTNVRWYLDFLAPGVISYHRRKCI